MVSRPWRAGRPEGMGVRPAGIPRQSIEADTPGCEEYRPVTPHDTQVCSLKAQLNFFIFHFNTTKYTNTETTKFIQIYRDARKVFRIFITTLTACLLHNLFRSILFNRFRQSVSGSALSEPDRIESAASRRPGRSARSTDCLRPTVIHCTEQHPTSESTKHEVTSPRSLLS